MRKSTGLFLGLMTLLMTKRGCKMYRPTVLNFTIAILCSDLFIKLTLISNLFSDIFRLTWILKTYFRLSSDSATAQHTTWRSAIASTLDPSNPGLKTILQSDNPTIQQSNNPTNEQIIQQSNKRTNNPTIQQMSKKSNN